MYFLIRLVFLLFLYFQFVQLAPALCRSCNKNCFVPNDRNSTENGTMIDVDLLAELELDENEITDSTKRVKRDVEFRACSRFQIEMLLIPLAIAMIPLVLCALFLCTCCCGPKESRGKLPEDFLSSLPMSKKREKSEEIELKYGEGFVQRVGSRGTKFSTTVSYIEARRESIWSATSVASDTVSNTAAETVKQEAEKAAAAAMSAKTTPAKLSKSKSVDSIKRTRFSDTVSVISLDR
ncbi:unnamed protein product [Caenorhabditis angaria]|uniref:Uncharacterized protein n=1 Tax=Caenorhabditis angaria TaxID=860376 RepID=A0A9P1ICL3_9PELO|nr:unnamed protein product [Caenorhabditis angaria]